jgi:hypothetical protein
MPTAPRALSANYYLLALDGKEAGFIQSFEGGYITAEVVAERPDALGISKKHISGPVYQPVIMQFGMSTVPALKDWIQGFFERKHKHKNISIITVGADLKPVSETEYVNALITEIGFPALDGSSKDPAFLTVKIQPEQIRPKKISGKIGSKANAKQKQSLTSNFRLTVDGVDCSKVSEISGFTIKQNYEQDDLGIHRDVRIIPTSLEFSNLSVMFSAVTAQSWQDWFDDFVVQGNNGDDKEKLGSIEYLAPNLQDVLMAVKLLNVGIYSLKTEKAGTDQVMRMTAELYCEQMTLDFG